MMKSGRRVWTRIGATTLLLASAVGVLLQACGSSTSNPFSAPSSSGGSASATQSASGGSSGMSTTSGTQGATSAIGSTSGASDGGASSSASGSDAAASKSTGCGVASLPTPDSIPDGGGYFGGTLPLQRFVMNVDAGGGAREFILGLPASYNANQPYPVVFAWHPMGGTDVQVAWGGNSASDLYNGYYGLRYLSGQDSRPMIFIAAQGLNPNDAGAGWPNTNGQDVAFAQAMVAWVEAHYCVDTSRLFSVGFSYGGIMSNTVGCQMGNVFRAIAPMDGFGPGYGFGSPGCVGHVGAWVAHGAQDTTIAIEAGLSTRDYWAQANHCSTTTQPLSPAPCVAFQGCDPGYPVGWCEFDGGHQMESFEPGGVWAFLQQF